MGTDDVERVNGYWLGGPTRFQFSGPELSPGDSHSDRTVYRHALSTGGELWVTETGLVFMDFSGLDRILTQSEFNDGPFDDNRKYKAASITTRRVEFLNAHQLCLLSAIGYQGDEDDLWFQEPRPVSALSCGL
jgi:hypothetical protein